MLEGTLRDQKSGAMCLYTSIWIAALKFAEISLGKVFQKKLLQNHEEEQDGCLKPSP